MSPNMRQTKAKVGGSVEEAVHIQGVIGFKINFFQYILNSVHYMSMKLSGIFLDIIRIKAEFGNKFSPSCPGMPIR